MCIHIYLSLYIYIYIYTLCVHVHAQTCVCINSYMYGYASMPITMFCLDLFFLQLKTMPLSATRRQALSPTGPHIFYLYDNIMTWPAKNKETIYAICHCKQWYAYKCVYRARTAHVMFLYAWEWAKCVLSDLGHCNCAETCLNLYFQTLSG